jgi:transcriptional regulator with XRE-family HTH domain
MARVVEFLGFNPLQKCDTLAQQIVSHRKARGITQKQFAWQLGIDPSTLARWERGEREPLGKFAKLVTSRLSMVTESRTGVSVR